ncbi:MAG: phosphate signaling complex protein PhoU [Bacteroidota bacterium]|nr:phosphate signaling complex protein PhoU [Bacteroidota bacterium]
MSRHFEQSLQELKSKLIKMGSLAEESINRSIQAVLNKDYELAKTIIEEDKRINEMEIDIDQAIIDVLALQQPVASDLRLILAASKINNDLERIGDHGVNLAESALALRDKDLLESSLEDVKRMCQLTKRMVGDALDGFIHGDANLGEAVLLMDDSVDNLNRKITKDLMEIMKSQPANIEQSLEMIRVSRNLERVADLATNIAEEVVFIAKARIVKHHSADDLATKQTET